MMLKIENKQSDNRASEVDKDSRSNK